MNSMDRGNENALAVALGSEVHTMNMLNLTIPKLYIVESEVHVPLSVSWSKDGKILSCWTSVCRDTTLGC